MGFYPDWSWRHREFSKSRGGGRYDCGWRLEQEVSLEASLSADNSYALIGNGGLASDNSLMQSDITVTTTAGDIVLTGGQGNDDQFAQIGNTGVQSATTETEGSITVTALAGKVSLNGAGDASGNILPVTLRLVMGGWGANGDYNGVAGDSIQVSAQTVELLGSTNGLGGYVQIGNGGYNADANAAGSITVIADEVNLTAGSVADAYAQIGHGGTNSDGRLQGDIDVTANCWGDQTGLQHWRSSQLCSDRAWWT